MKCTNRLNIEVMTLRPTRLDWNVLPSSGHRHSLKPLWMCRLKCEKQKGMIRLGIFVSHFRSDSRYCHFRGGSIFVECIVIVQHMVE